MRFTHVRLRDFRNIAFADIDLDADRVFLTGGNGQGKSNLLEALGWVTALRSFRGASPKVVARRGGEGFAAVHEIRHEREGELSLEVAGGADARCAAVDGEPVERLGDWMGRFPAVAMSSGDLMLLRGGPGERRRFMDVLLSMTNPAYFADLRRYHRGVAERNRLLKEAASDAELAAFEADMGARAARLVTRRSEAAAWLRERVEARYAWIAEADEGPSFAYAPDVEAGDAEAFARRLRDERSRDRALGLTRRGPHRDDFPVALEVGGARDFASDGQQRGLCLALRMAEANYLREALGIAPVVLADDVLGELDPSRETGFWKACDRDLQTIATGTDAARLGDASGWSLIEVREGEFRQGDR